MVLIQTLESAWERGRTICRPGRAVSKRRLFEGNVPINAKPAKNIGGFVNSLSLGQ